MPLPRITRKRRYVQSLLIAAALLLPFASISGNPFLRMDIAKMTLFLAGIPLRIDQFYLLLLLILLGVTSFLLLTVVLGRVWCGWLCPQTVLSDLTDLLGEKTRKLVSPATARLVDHIVAMVIAAVVAFNLFSWFIPPRQAFRDLSGFSDHQLMFVTFLFMTLFGYLNLMLVKRSFCRSYCPYGRFQTALVDDGTLNLSFLEETRHLCLRCNACVRNCPMGIDIREGFQVECIGCGRCIDACRTVMERKPDGTGLIDYRFGTAKGTRFRVGSTAVFLLVASLLLTIGLVWGIGSRSQSAFAVQRVATAELRHLPDGSVAQPWRGIIGNRSESPQVYTIQVAGEPSGGIELLGQTSAITVAANQHREITFMIHIAKNARQPEKLQIQLLSAGRPAASVIISP